MRSSAFPHQSNSLLLYLAVLITGAMLHAPVAGHSATKQTEEHASPSDHRPVRTLQILAINDFHGQLTGGIKLAGRPVGSAPVLAAYLREAQRGREDRTFIVHAGDLVGASPPESALLQDEPTLMFLNGLANAHCRGPAKSDPHCNIVGTLGNHEFDEGKDELMRLIYGGNHNKGPFLQAPWQGAQFPYVCANVLRESDGQPLLPPYVLKKVGKEQVAFIGAVFRDVPTSVAASGIAGLRFVDEAQAINQQVKALKRLGVRAIVVLLHQGGTQTAYEGPTGAGTSDLSGEVLPIVKQLDSEVDVVISGHTHSFTNALVENAQGAKILVTQSMAKGAAYAAIDLTIDPTTHDVVRKSARIVPTWADTGAGANPDPQVAALVARAKAATTPLTGRVIAHAAVDLPRSQNTAGESPLGNLIADAQRAQMGTDFAFINPGGIRADLAKGPTTWGALYTVQPFNNDLIRLRLTGQQITDLLNQQFPPVQSIGRVLQLSGLGYTWDNARPQGDKIVEIHKADGTPLDPQATYTVTVNSFLAEGGDNFTIFTQGTDPVVGPSTDLEALVAYVQKLPQPITAALEGRITRRD